MCRACDRGFYLTPHGIVFGDDNGRGGGGGGGGFLWDPTWNEVSGRALEEGKRAERIFLDFLARADTSRGPVTEEIINFHLVQKVLKQFRDFVKARGCIPKGRKLTREEQNKVNKHRKSLMTYTSVTVTKEAQDAYLKANPHLTPPAPVASSSSMNPTYISSTPKTKQKREADLDLINNSTAPKKKKKTTKL